MLYLVDASVYVFRAYYSVSDDLTDPLGRPVNAVYGFTKFLCDLLQTEQPTRVAVAFDESLTTSFRNEIYPQYKANREEAPPELMAQFARCRELCDHLGVFSCASAEYEADDLIGSLLQTNRPPGQGAVLVTRDKDLAQLIEPGDIFFDYSQGTRLGYDDVPQRWGVAANQIADLLALTGDAVDNIPGVPGIGPKTAARLLNEFPDLEALLANIQAVGSMKLRGAARIMNLLDTHSDTVRLARRLTGIKTDIPMAVAADDLLPAGADGAGLNRFFDQLGFAGRLRDQALLLVKD
jgi:5'-3' exonuclease